MAQLAQQYCISYQLFKHTSKTTDMQGLVMAW